MNFRQFALKNVTRNMRTYSAYFLSSAFSVMMFFVYAMFISHPSLVAAEFGAAKTAISVAEFIIYIFSFFFVFYSVSAFLKSRKKEFGILMMHGMSKQQINWLVFMENMIIGGAAIISGVIAGMIFSNLFLMIGANVMRIEKLPFYWPWKALLITTIAFSLLFFVISAFTTILVRGNKIIELLRGSAKPKREPKPSLILSALAAILLLTGYVISFLVKGPMVVVAMLPVVTIVIIGTYFLFSQLSVFTIRSLKRNRNVYWRRTNLIAISDLAYRMKDNARMYFLVAIVSTVTICALGTFAGFQEAMIQMTKDEDPFVINYTSYKDNLHEEKHIAQIETALKEKGLEYTKLEARKVVFLTDANKDRTYGIIPLSEFNRFSTALGYAKETLNDQEAIKVTPSRQTFNFNEPNKVQEQDNIAFKESPVTLVKKKDLERTVFSSRFLEYESYFVVTDDTYKAINIKPDKAYIAFNVPDEKETVDIGKHLSEQFYSEENQAHSFVATSTNIDFLKQVYSLILFVGLFISSVFFIATGSFIYFRLYTDLTEDKKQYQAIAKIGFSERELSKVASTQVALLFYAPFIVAVIHSSVAMYALHSFFNMSVFRSAAMVIGGFFVAQTLLFLLIRFRYVKHLKEAIR
ncbi:FtsX-like permease family protein [Bacillus chungangensis]|uniref:ABC transport system permease protein n=1 Tax=Bacillus chungangensis TaxID=587633 RepID=A0ABT9WZ48_9BACI|nr:ABC transporter permease [Bacillus chungangensis]MDQ0178569.1 putative ABC transport system permease protein [Bacillus chungangensis]